MNKSATYSARTRPVSNGVNVVTKTKKLTILVEADVYRALQKRVGRGNIGRFLSDVARPHLAHDSLLRAGYAEMACDSEREGEALAWSEGLIEDSYDAKRSKRK